MISFTSYSLLLYLSDEHEGGETTFFAPDDAVRMSRRKLTPSMEDLELLTPVARVRGHAGDVLIFPHGAHAGCHPNPLHEGSTVDAGEKVIIRTDVVFSCPSQKLPKRERNSSYNNTTARGDKTATTSASDEKMTKRSLNEHISEIPSNSTRASHKDVGDSRRMKAGPSTGVASISGITDDIDEIERVMETALRQVRSSFLFCLT